MARALTELDIPYEREVQIGPYRADFVIDGKSVIEVDGLRWHGTELRKAKDRRRDRYLVACGFQVWRFPEKEVVLDARGCVLKVLGRA